MAEYYFYNGQKLPALPEWDKETYPYAFINVALQPTLHVSKEPAIYGTREGYGDLKLVQLHAGALISKYSATSGEWGAFETKDSDIFYNIVSGAWSNHDIINTEDGSVYLAASEPVPVGGDTGETTIIPSDTYIKKGNKVYKVNGGGSTDIKTFNSVEEMNAANLADGSIACVPSSGESGGQTAKVIDLEDEKYGEYSTNLLTFILTLTSGAFRVPDGSNTNDLILAECDTEQPLVFKFGGTMGDMALKVESRTVNKAYINGSLMQVAFSAMMYYEGVIIDFTISFMYGATALSLTKTPTSDTTA